TTFTLTRPNAMILGPLLQRDDGVNGNLTSQTDAKNRTIRFAYDNLDRLIRKTYAGTDNYSKCVYGGGSNVPFFLYVNIIDSRKCVGFCRDVSGFGCRNV